MASKGSVKAYHPNNGAYWSFEWTAKATSTKGQTKVSYDIYKRGRSSSPTWLATDCDISVYYNGSWHDILSTGRRKPGSSDNGCSFANDFEDDGDFTVVHSSDGSGSFIVSISAYIDSGSNWEHNASAYETCTLDTNLAYSSCTAPTSISASGIVAPNGEVTVSWSGASGGTSNSINGYNVYWRITSEGNAPSTGTNSGMKEIELNEDWKDGEGKATINIGDATRGHNVVFGVVTKGSAGSSYYSGITTGGSVKVNSLPTKPLGGTVSPTLVPASGGTVTFNITPGTDSDGQPVGLKYATSATGEKIPCASSFPLSGVGAGTYYFWSNDGLEDSADYYTVSVSSNTKPTVTIKVAGT
jgi:hypothetical protein